MIFITPYSYYIVIIIFVSSVDSKSCEGVLNRTRHVNYARWRSYFFINYAYLRTQEIATYLMIGAKVKLDLVEVWCVLEAKNRNLIIPNIPAEMVINDNLCTHQIIKLLQSVNRYDTQRQICNTRKWSIKCKYVQIIYIQSKVLKIINITKELRVMEFVIL